MPVVNKIPAFSIWNYLAWGDIGDWTLYRGHQCQMVIFAKTWPDKPASPRQLDHRAKYKAAVAAWWALSAFTRAQWELASKRASLTCTGFNLWIHWQLIQDEAAIRTLERQTGTVLIPP